MMTADYPFPDYFLEQLFLEMVAESIEFTSENEMDAVEDFFRRYFHRRVAPNKDIEMCGRALSWARLACLRVLQLRQMDDVPGDELLMGAFEMALFALGISFTPRTPMLLRNGEPLVRVLLTSDPDAFFVGGKVTINEQAIEALIDMGVIPPGDYSSSFEITDLHDDRAHLRLHDGSEKCVPLMFLNVDSSSLN